uniref:MYND-type domain-containing protein n=1 Tax=Alexandrium monilatum TaxID=311494 RepID=A0A6T1N434_9DINO|mmetsp:Transcript_107381/g.321110  ORF Transcript_107381/g.321110 Transcript_107381/m.321110 type:complete len:312 (+) Transcript_107381:61-996(+)
MAGDTGGTGERGGSSRRLPDDEDGGSRGLLGTLLASQNPELKGSWRSAVVEACAGCAADTPPHLCSRCRGVAYCGPDCQRRHWPVHKSACSRASPLSTVRFVHTVWGLWDAESLPEDCRKSRAAAARLLPSSRLTIWDRNAVENLLSDEWKEVWHALPRGVCQADIARYLIAFHVGGIYLDADAELMQAPPEGSWSLLLLIEQKVPDAKYLGPRESPHLIRMAQFMFATAPQHDFWRSVLELSLGRCRQRLAEGGEWVDGDVLWATGPDVVTTVFHERFGSDSTIEVRLAREFVRHECRGAWRKGADRRGG